MTVHDLHNLSNSKANLNAKGKAITLVYYYSGRYG